MQAVGAGILDGPLAFDEATGTSADSAESPVGSRCESRTAMPGATSHAFGRLRQQATGNGGTEKAFPLGGRWHGEAVTDEGAFDRGNRNLDSSSVARLYTAPGWAGSVGLIAPMSDCFCASCTRVRLTADGKLKPCLHSSEEFPLRGLHGDELQAAILSAIQKKPARHYLIDTGASESVRPMNEIGG